MMTKELAEFFGAWIAEVKPAAPVSSQRNQLEWLEEQLAAIARTEEPA